MRLRFIQFVSYLLLAALVLGGCGNGSTDGTGLDGQDASGSEPAERLVRHALGETRVPANPQRVVVLDMGELDMALALGVQPVGAAFYLQDQPLPSYLQDKVQGEIARVGTVGQPNLEAIAALEPDLIITNQVRHKDIYDKLSQIAPTVMAESLGAGWKDQFRVVAEALGKTSEYEQIMRQYHARLEEFKQAMGERLGQTQVSLVRSFPDHVRIYLKQSFSGAIVQDAGLPRPPAQDKDDFALQLTAPAEHIPEMDGDVIFVFYYNREQGEQLSQVMATPAWSRLRAVQAGRVYEVSDEVWGTGLGPIAAQLVVDDLFQYLVR